MYKLLKNLIEMDDYSVQRFVKRGSKKLPDGYIKADYIESSGTQYIDTGYLPNNNTKVDIKFMGLNNTANVTPLFGGRTSAETETYTTFYNVGSIGRVDYGKYSTSAPTVRFVNGRIHTFIKDKEKNYLDGKYINSNDPINFSCNYPLYINSINTAGTPSATGLKAKLYYTKIYDNNKLVRDLVPAVKKASKNLLNRATCVENKLLTWASGTPYDETGSLVTDYMEVKIGDKFVSNYRYQKMFYDKDKNYLGALCTDGTLQVNRADIANTTTNFVVPNISDIVYVRLGYIKSLNSNTDMTTVDIMLNEGTEALPYEPYSPEQVGMYDLANDVFYTNDGTGEFGYEYNGEKKDPTS